MKTRKSLCLPSVVILIVMLSGCEPIETYPGLRIGGTPTPIPETWSTPDLYSALIETRSWFPYVVTVGYLGTTEGLYMMVLTDALWLTRLRENPDVRFRIDDATYEMTAIFMEDRDEIEAFLPLYNEKYGEEIEDAYGFVFNIENFADHVVPVRLVARD